MLTLATTVLSVEAGDYSPYAHYFPIVVGFTSILGLLTVDRDPRLGLAPGLANALAIFATGLALVEFRSDSENMLLLALGHWLVYLQLIKMILPKSVEDDWFLFSDALVQVVIGVVLSGSGVVGTLLGLYAFSALWTLGLFQLRREIDRESPPPEVSITPRLDRDQPYRGLLNFGFLLSALLVALTSLALGVLIFLLIPRSSRTAPRGGPAAPATTGFSPDVKLGEIGKILENQDVVMTVELFDGDGDRVRPGVELLWRGISLVQYQNGIWHRDTLLPDRSSRLSTRNLPISRRIRQRIKLERWTDETLFALRPIYEVRTRRRSEILFNRFDGTLIRDDFNKRGFYDPSSPHPGTFDYEVTSSTSRDDPQFDELPPLEGAFSTYLQIPPEIRDELADEAQKALEYARLTSGTRTNRARAMESYLRDSGRFYYSLEKTRIDTQIDPVLDFLKNRREGHCEYYASALALMLRTMSIPSRVINGFKGGDYNDVFGTVTLRERDAHSWVEAYLGPDANDRPIWLTLDPTPSFTRPGKDEATSWSFSESLRHIWLFYIDGFDPERQVNAIYAPLRGLGRQIQLGFSRLGSIILSAGRWLFIYRRAGEFFSVRGFAVSVVVMLALSGLAFGLRLLIRRLFGRSSDDPSRADGLASEVAFFHRLTRMLAASGFDRPSWETPREFARRASSLLPVGPDPVNGLLDVPSEVVEAFYRVYYGGHPLPPPALQRLEERLDALESRLQASRD